MFLYKPIGKFMLQVISRGLRCNKLKGIIGNRLRTSLLGSAYK
jgi:hypothetical protein